MKGVSCLYSFVMEIEEREFYSKLLSSSRLSRNVHQHEELPSAIVLEGKCYHLL